MNRRDPRIRQTLNRINSTLESANLTTQASLFSFSQSYITPCLASFTTCLEASCYPCYGARRDAERRRKRMGRSTQRGRPELVFDFYNDEWDDLEEGEGAGLLGGWGNDELDRLLAGSGVEGIRGEARQPGRKRAMSYGSRGAQRKGLGLPGKGGETDPTVLPNSSMFGFLERLPWKIGGRGVKYKPSAADLQENPGRKSREEIEALLEESEGEGGAQRHRRKRSNTTASRSTNNSLSSRGDLFPSEDEDDAIPLDDEFAMVLERRNTGPGASEASNGKTGGNRPSASRISTKTASSKDTENSGDKVNDGALARVTSVDEAAESELPTLEDLEREEEHVRNEEAMGIERRRQAARKLAVERGLVLEDEDVLSHEARHPDPPPEETSQHDLSAAEEEPPPLSRSSIDSMETRRTDDSGVT